VPSNQNPLGSTHKIEQDNKGTEKLAKTLIPHGRLAMQVCREVIHQLEKAHEFRHLTVNEISLLKLLKARILGLAAIEKSRARQRSSLIRLRKEDANSRYFHLMANVRKKKNFIQSLQTDNGPTISQQQKHDVIFNHFNNHMSTYVPRNLALNFSSLGWQQRDLHHLELPLSEEEIH
jgi:hypothetical protein